MVVSMSAPRSPAFRAASATSEEGPVREMEIAKKFIEQQQRLRDNLVHLDRAEGGAQSRPGAELATIIAAPLRWHAMFQTHISTVETPAVALPGLELLATAVVLLTDDLGVCCSNNDRIVGSEYDLADGCAGRSFFNSFSSSEKSFIAVGNSS